MIGGSHPNCKVALYENRYFPLVNENPSDSDLHFLEDRINEYNVETTGISAIQLAIPEFTTSQTKDVAKLGDLNRHSEGDQLPSQRKHCPRRLHERGEKIDWLRERSRKAWRSALAVYLDFAEGNR